MKNTTKIGCYILIAIVIPVILVLCSRGEYHAQATYNVLHIAVIKHIVLLFSGVVLGYEQFSCQTAEPGSLRFNWYKLIVILPGLIVFIAGMGYIHPIFKTTVFALMTYDSIIFYFFMIALGHSIITGFYHTQQITDGTQKP